MYKYAYIQKQINIYVYTNVDAMCVIGHPMSMRIFDKKFLNCGKKKRQKKS